MDDDHENRRVDKRVEQHGAQAERAGKAFHGTTNLKRRQPTPSPSKEGNIVRCAFAQLPSWEGSGVGLCVVIFTESLPPSRPFANKPTIRSAPNPTPRTQSPRRRASRGSGRTVAGSHFRASPFSR